MSRSSDQGARQKSHLKNSLPEQAASCMRNGMSMGAAPISVSSAHVTAGEPQTESGLPAECPRCGYDLGGSAATWIASCPMAGECSECGLALEWADVLNPARRRLDGFF